VGAKGEAGAAEKRYNSLMTFSGNVKWTKRDREEKQPMKKTCTKCKKEKKETDFPLTKVRGRMLRRSWCDSCMKEYYKAYALAKAKK